ncbi:GntR family transcriptional regulator [Brevibacterium oceani]|uniref:GntR family transcriptional regulator n=1 Tax=Brevibacterium oceani TaxID=358099 RepID=UPI0015E6B904|nr:GntR family transcriptional regulator [Brevibacterium oceani]
MTTALTPLPDVKNRSETIAQTIRQHIISGHFQPEDTLVDRRIAEELGVSKTPVREALLLLQHTGLVTTTPTRRMKVASLTRDDVFHIFQQRALLEPWAVLHSEITSEAIVAARAALTNATQARTNEDGAGAALANRDFHHALYSQCTNPYIVTSLDGLQDLTALATASVIWNDDDRAETDHVGHEVILDSVAAGQLEEAAKMLEKHIFAWIGPPLKPRSA